MRIMRKFRRLFGIALLLGLAIFVFQAYHSRAMDLETGQVRDGLGRQLYESPFLIRVILRESQWPGLKWHLADWIIGWGALIAGFYLIGAGSEE